jgi:hypothetical protein
MNSLRLPPLRDLPPGRLEQRQLHLLEELAGPASLRRSRSRWHRRTSGLAVATAVTAVVVVVTLVTSQWGAAGASAAQVRASITRGLSTPRSIRGAFVVESRPAETQPRPAHECSNCKAPFPVPSAFVLGADGSYSFRALAATRQFPASAAYDATADVMTQVGNLGVRDGLLYVRTTGNNPGFTSFRPESELAAWVLYALDSGDNHVTSTSFEGRDAWALTLDFTPGDDYYDTYGARVDVIVDKETGLVLKLTQYENDPAYWTSIETIHDLELDGPTTPADFTLAIPAGARVVEHDQGFVPVTPKRAAALVGYRPLLPANTGGRALTVLAAAKESKLAFLPVINAPVYRDAVTARYGRGLDAITVSTRRGSRLDVVPDLTARTITIHDGPLTGATAYVSASPTVPGYLSTYSHGLVVEINAPSAAEALAAAESLGRR